MLSGEIGIDPITVMDELNVSQAELIIKGYQKRLMNEWAQTQRIGYIIAQTNSKKRISPNSIVDLTTFDNNIFDDNLLSTDENNPTVDAEMIRDRMKEIADSYKKVIEN